MLDARIQSSSFCLLHTFVHLFMHLIHTYLLWAYYMLFHTALCYALISNGKQRQTWPLFSWSVKTGGKTNSDKDECVSVMGEGRQVYEHRTETGACPLWMSYYHRDPWYLLQSFQGTLYPKALDKQLHLSLTHEFNTACKAGFWTLPPSLPSKPFTCFLFFPAGIALETDKINFPLVPHRFATSRSGGRQE